MNQGIVPLGYELNEANKKNIEATLIKKQKQQATENCVIN